MLFHLCLLLAGLLFVAWSFAAADGDAAAAVVVASLDPDG